MSTFLRAGLYPIYLRAKGCVARALTIECPICREQVGHACRFEDGAPVVHDARESLAYNGKKIWA